MKAFRLKLRLIYYPFLLSAAGFIALYSLLNIGLTIQTTTFSLKEDVTDLWVPLVLPFVILAIWLRPRINLLNLKTKGAKNLPVLYLIIAGLAIGVPALLLQRYLRPAMGKMTTLTSISQIRESNPTNYYSVKNYYLNTSAIVFKNTARISGKHSESLDYSIYMACPMYDRPPLIAPPAPAENVKIGAVTATSLPDSINRVSQIHSDGSAAGSTGKNGSTGEDGNGEKDRSGPLPQAWVCINYKEQISNGQRKDEKDAAWGSFFDNSLEDFRQKNADRFVYLERIGNTEDRDYYENAIIQNPSITTIPAPLFILEARTTPFEARTGNQLAWVFGAFGIGALLWLLMLDIPPLDESGLRAFGLEKVKGEIFDRETGDRKIPFWIKGDRGN